MEKTIEQRAAQTILEEPIGELTIDGQTYAIPAPTTATLMRVSALISTLPELDLSLPETQLPDEMLHKAKDATGLGKIAATLILGAKKIRAIENRRWWERLIKRNVITIDALADKILLNCTPEKIRNLIMAILEEAGIEHFFIITTSLRTRNLLAATRTEVEKATAPGLSSEPGQNTSK